MFIFELDPNAKISHDQFYRVSATLLFVWSLCFCFTLMEFKLQWLFSGQPAYFMLALVIFFLLYCTQCCLKCGYRRARYQLLITLKEIIISPFGRVRFRDFFFADVITSLGGSLQDFGTTLYYILSDDFKKEKLPSGTNEILVVYFIIVSFLPFWWRFWQCVNKYHYTGLIAH